MTILSTWNSPDDIRWPWIFRSILIPDCFFSLSDSESLSPSPLCARVRDASAFCLLCFDAFSNSVSGILPSTLQRQIIMWKIISRFSKLYFCRRLIRDSNSIFRPGDDQIDIKTTRSAPRYDTSQSCSLKIPLNRGDLSIKTQTSKLTKLTALYCTATYCNTLTM